MYQSAIRQNSCGLVRRSRERERGAEIASGETGMTRSETDAGPDADATRQEGTQPLTERDPARLARGSVLAGKDRLESRLGEGGMAVVWSAYHLELEVPVAIKLLHGHDASLARRLKLEARAAARLVHPAIVRILDVATTSQGDPFIVMELLT